MSILSSRPLGVSALSRPGIPGDYWSWVDVMMEDVVVPRHLTPERFSVKVPPPVPLSIRFCEKLVNPELAQRWVERTPQTKDTVWHEVLDTVERRFAERFGCLPTRLTMDGDELSADSRNFPVVALHLPPEGFLTDLDTIELYTLLRRRLTQENAAELLPAFLDLSFAQQETARCLLDGDLYPRDVLTAASLL